MATINLLAADLCVARIPFSLPSVSPARGGDAGMIGSYHARHMNVRERTDSNHADDQDERAQIALAQGNPQAFAPLYARYFDPVHRYCYRRLRDPERAADATSQIFLKALASLPGYRGGSFRSWLFAIAHNVVIDTIRQTKPQSMLPDEWDLPDDQPTPEQRTILEDDRRRLWGTARPPDARTAGSRRVASGRAHRPGDRRSDRPRARCHQEPAMARIHAPQAPARPQ